MAIWALGTDTGGSVRQPASLSGVVGFKPTYGLISRYGLIAFASSLDTVGTFTRSVRDAATLLSAIAGKDPMDATSLDTPRRDYTEGLEEGVAGLRVGVITEAFGEGVEPGVRDSVRAGVDALERLGATVGEVSLPHTDYALSAYYLIAPSEASSNLARYDGVRYGLRVDGSDSVEMMTKTRGAGFGAEVKRRIMLGTYALSAGYYEAYYGQAQKVRTLIIRDYEAAFANHDVLVSPTSPTTAFPIGAKVDDPLAMYLNDVFTIPANLSGMPAISIPSGLDEQGLPVGLAARPRRCSRSPGCSAPRTRSRTRSVRRPSVADRGAGGLGRVLAFGAAGTGSGSRAVPPLETMSATATTITAAATIVRSVTGSSRISQPRNTPTTGVTYA